MRRKRLFCYFTLFGFILWIILFRDVKVQNALQYSANLFTKYDATEHIRQFFQQAPTLRERLLLIDKIVLKKFQRDKELGHPSCLFCSVTRYQPITFALVTPVNRSLEEHILLPILRAWEGGFWVEQIVNSKYDKFSPIRLNLPLGFVLQKGGAALILEIVLLHQREGDFWWHGALDQDAGVTAKLKNLKLTDGRNLLVLNNQGAFDKVRFETVALDGLEFNTPRDIPQFLSTSNFFIECNYERADRFHRTFGRDASGRANMFRHRVRKLLAMAKAILDGLRIPFWISSGTLLGYFRQCDVIPYSQDVDIGIFIQDFNETMIGAFAARGLRLKHRFGRVSDSLELSFSYRAVKLDIFFFYEEKDHVWNGGHAVVYGNGGIDSGIKFRYKFAKFSLCWSEFLDMKVRIPCETEPYITANYGPNWFKPVSKWHWYKDPFNVEEVGVWTADEVAEVLQIF